MYSFILALHNLTRWLVLIFLVVTVVRSLAGWLGHRKWTGLDNRLGLGLTSSMDIQILLGLVLYLGASPFMRQAFSDLSAAMANRQVSFFLIDHFFSMLVAIVLAHIGRARVKKASDDRRKFLLSTLFYGVALILVLTAIPWQRPLLPF